MILRRLRLRRDYPCRQLVEAVTDYLEGTMPARERARLERHLKACEGCEAYVGQIRRTIELTGRLTEADVEAMAPEAREALLMAFRRAGAR